MKLFFIVLSAFLFLQDSGQDERIEELIQQLDADAMVERADAADELAKIGEPALKALEAAAGSENAELASRATEIIKQIHTIIKLKKVYPDPKMVSLEKKDAPLSEVLAEIGKQTDLTVNEQGVDGTRTVSVSLSKATPYEALDAVCRQLKDILWEDQSDNTIIVKKGAFADTPASYYEHFRVYLTEIEYARKTNFTKKTGNVTFYVDFKHRDCVESSFLPIVVIDKVVDDTGAELKNAMEDVQMNQKMMVMRAMGKFGEVAEGTMFAFEGAGAGAKSLKTLSGTVRVSFPLDKAEIKFDSVVKGAKESAGKFDVEIGNINRNYVQITITSNMGPVDFSQIVDPTSVEVLDADGNDLEANARIGGGGLAAGNRGGGGAQNSYSFYVMLKDRTSVPATMKMTIVNEIHTKEIPFEFKDLDLP